VSQRPLRFATQTGSAPSGEEWLARARRLETIGYVTLSMPDHMVGAAWGSLPALAAAAAVTTTLRLGNLVLDNDFRNPVVLARELATLDVISGGRVEIGLGAGWFDRDYQSIGVPFDRGRVRVERLAEAVALIKRLFTEDDVTFEGRYYRTERSECRPKTVQKPHPPLLIAAGGPRILELAGREADIIAIIPYGIGARKTTADDVTFDAARAQIARIRSVAGDRFGAIELSQFLDVTLTDHREAKIREMSEKAKSDPEILRRSMYTGIGTLEQVRDQIRENHRQLGITYFCLRGPHVEELAPVVKELAGT
jgi:probable F420-dependent oxidoreductase